MGSSFKIGFLSDSHLGYSARCRVHQQSGLNMRVRDGMLALRETVDQMIAAEVDLVIHGGDLFHKSWPQVADIVWARRQLNRLHAAGIPVVGNTGNHDASNERSKSPATASVHDPDRGVTMVTEPYAVVRPVDGLAVHMISHYGLAQQQRVLPEPVDGVVNVVSAHGAAMLPGHDVFRCVDSPGEQPIGLDLLADDRFAVKLLGHYHGMDEIMGGVWYAGSSVRRGFSDPAGGRGWLLADVGSDGSVRVQRQFISQRTQWDLPVVDAAGLTGAEVEEAVAGNIAGVDVADAIVRQVVVNCSTSVRRGIDRQRLNGLTTAALVWNLEPRRPEMEISVDGDSGAGSSMATAGAANLTSVYREWVGGWLHASAVAPELRAGVVVDGARHLARAAGQSAGDDADLTVPDDAPAGAPAETAVGNLVAAGAA